MGNPNPPKRGRVTGWSAGAARRNTNFLRSVDETTLDGFGLAVTLTLRECPPSPGAWAKLVQAWVKRQSRAHMRRLHWVMEFQRRGVPHLHAAVWYRERVEGESEAEAVTRLILRQQQTCTDWVDIASEYGAGPKGQKWRLIEGPVGWFQYMAKHVSRSKGHYQRQRESLPEAWQTTGRVWGHRGDWQTLEPGRASVTRRQFWRFRRLVKRARLAEARQYLPLNRRQVGHLRRLLKCSDRKLSEVRPISDWMPQTRQLDLLEAAAQGEPYEYQSGQLPTPPPLPAPVDGLPY